MDAGGGARAQLDVDAAVEKGVPGLETVVDPAALGVATVGVALDVHVLQNVLDVKIIEGKVAAPDVVVGELEEVDLDGAGTIARDQGQLCLSRSRRPSWIRAWMATGLTGGAETSRGSLWLRTNSAPRTWRCLLTEVISYSVLSGQMTLVLSMVISLAGGMSSWLRLFMRGVSSSLLTQVGQGQGHVEVLGTHERRELGEAAVDVRLAGVVAQGFHVDPALQRKSDLGCSVCKFDGPGCGEKFFAAFDGEFVGAWGKIGLKGVGTEGGVDFDARFFAGLAVGDGVSADGAGVVKFAVRGFDVEAAFEGIAGAWINDVAAEEEGVLGGG